MEDILIEMRRAFYSNVDPARKQELTDSRMVQEDHNAMSNLSPKEINREFNPGKYMAHFRNYNQDTKKWPS